MSLQYISDSEGKTTGVFIPISEWNALKERFRDLEIDSDSLPNWHQKELDERIIEYSANDQSSLDFNEVIAAIENSL